MKAIFSIFVLILFAVGPLAAQNQTAEKKVLKVVESLFDAMAQADSAKAASLFMDKGHSFVAVNEADGSVSTSMQNHNQFLSSIAGWEPGSVVERIWDATVMTKENIAMVWAPYDLHANGNFSHCGTNLLSLVNTADGWKIADITYSVKRQDCVDSSAGKN